MMKNSLKKALLDDTAFIELTGIKYTELQKHFKNTDIIVYRDELELIDTKQVKEFKKISDVNLSFFERKYFTNLWFIDYNTLVPNKIRKQMFDYVLRYGIADKVISIH